MFPPQDTRRDVDVMMVEWPHTPVGRSGTGLAHVEPEKDRYSTEEVLPERYWPPRTRRWSAGKNINILLFLGNILPLHSGLRRGVTWT